MLLIIMVISVFFLSCGGPYEVSTKHPLIELAESQSGRGLLLEGRIDYSGGAVCNGPSDEWPPLRYGAILDKGRRATTLADIDEAFIVGFDGETLSEETSSVFAVGTWGGTTVECNGIEMGSGAPLILSWVSSEVPASDPLWTDALSRMADSVEPVVDDDILPPKDP